MSFERGSIVYLKSGSPALTVTQMEGGCVSLAWFNGGQLNMCTIAACCLTEKDPWAQIPAASPLGRVLNLVPPDKPV